jgi:hypothetical protein
MQKKLTLFCAAVFLSIISIAQWKEVPESSLRLTQTSRVITPQQYRLFQLNKIELVQQLQKAPKEFTQDAKSAADNILAIPMPDGSVQRFKLFESSIFEASLQARYPEIKTYSGQGLDDPYASVRIDWNPYSGFHGRILSPKGDVYIDPYHQGNTEFYQTYYQRDFNQRDPFFEPSLRKVPGRSQNGLGNRTTVSAPCRGTQLFTYRIAVACTGEYAQAATGSMTPTVPATLAAIVTTINRVTQVYERDLTIRLILVGTNSNVVFTDPATDPFAGNDDAGVLIDESQRVIDSAIGNANYDIGHTFSTGGGGLAGLGVVCLSGFKALGITGSPAPFGDPYDIDYVAHEVGHQFGGNHTFRGLNGSCAGNGAFGPPLSDAFAAYEPGSGTTIQAYAGICFTDDMQPNSDPYFHAVSYDEIINFVTSGDGGTCKGVIATGNTIPVITAMNFNGVSIPIATPFELSATATDVDGDALTYSWEQWDVGLFPFAYNDFNGYVDGNAIWRSRTPSTDGKRTIPDIRYVAANYMPATPPSQMNGLRGETLSSLAKTYSFKLTVRDNKVNGGGISTGGGKPVDGVTGAGGVGCSFTTPFNITVVPGVFAVTAPNGGETYSGGTLQTVTWINTATNIAPINCMNVRITLSIDGGLTYPIIVLASTANDGTEQVVIPNVNPTTTTARLRVEAADNIFFDISNANFTIQYNATLPVSMKEFSVKAQGKNNALVTWTTLQEGNNSGFEIQRSIGSDGNFSSIGFVAAGSNSSGNSYQFLNENLPFNTNIYFRLRQIDRNGESKLSEIRMVRFTDRGMYITIQPNPVKDYINIINAGAVILNADIQVYDITGRLVKRTNTALQQSTRLSLSEVPNGVYTVRISSNGNEIIKSKLVKE